MPVDEKRAKNELKNFLKRFPQYKFADSIEDADIAVVFSLFDRERFLVLEVEPKNKEKFGNYPEEIFKVCFLKHKNPRNKKQIIDSDICRKYYKASR